MNTTQHLLDLKTRPKLRLSEIERLIRKHRIIVPPLSRRSLIAMCEEGTLEAVKGGSGRIWLVFEESFLRWIRELESGGGTDN